MMVIERSHMPWYIYAITNEIMKTRAAQNTPIPLISFSFSLVALFSLSFFRFFLLFCLCLQKRELTKEGGNMIRLNKRLRSQLLA